MNNRQPLVHARTHVQTHERAHTYAYTHTSTYRPAHTHAYAQTNSGATADVDYESEFRVFNPRELVGIGTLLAVHAYSVESVSEASLLACFLIMHRGYHLVASSVHAHWLWMKIDSRELVRSFCFSLFTSPRLFLSLVFLWEAKTGLLRKDSFAR